ncbi:MAG: efflux RND transporter periplasmic adaptor subunit [Phycisphaerae bacterium]
MRKLIGPGVLAVVLVIAYLMVKNFVRVPISAIKPEFDVVRRGDLIVPITASGNIRPASVTNIKSEASGEVIELPFDLDQYVRKGDLVVRLDETDEQRNVARATAEYQRAVIAYEQAKIRKELNEKVGVDLAKAKLEQAEAQEEVAKLEDDRQERLKATDFIGQYEAAMVKAKYKQAAAATLVAKAQLTEAELNVKMAEKEVAAADEMQKAAQRAKEEAEERLKETKVLSPLDGVVVARHVQIGELVQSGRTSLTGGTVLLEIADVSEVYAVVNVDEADIGQVRQLFTETNPAVNPAATQLATLPEGTIETGQKVNLTVETYPADEGFYGVIERISPQSEMSRAIATFKVWIRVTSPNRDKLKKVLNAQVQANFTARSVANALLVNYEAMKPDPSGQGYGVYVPEKVPGTNDERPKFVPCEFGVDNRVEVEVKKGLEEGQRVYTKLPIKTEREKKRERERSEE